jgi:hypothetical protein
LLAVHEDGFKFVNYRTKDVIMQFTYAQLKNVEVNSYEDSITFNMDPKSLDDAPLYMFLCPRKEDVANLIASYSPAHRNWKQVSVGVPHCLNCLFGAFFLRSVRCSHATLRLAWPTCCIAAQTRKTRRAC